MAIIGRIRAGTGRLTSFITVQKCHLGGFHVRVWKRTLDDGPQLATQCLVAERRDVIPLVDRLLSELCPVGSKVERLPTFPDK